jgi:hypothetical protein
MNKYIAFTISALVFVVLVGCSVQKPPTEINNVANTTSADDLALIKQALVSTTKWPADKTTVTVLQNTGDHARGGVSFQDDKDAAGAIWFAVKENGNWKIIWSGNGNISCSQMKSAGFIDAMIPDCCATCKTSK